jgi:hypothetical protein
MRKPGFDPHHDVADAVDMSWFYRHTISIFTIIKMGKGGFYAHTTGLSVAAGSARWRLGSAATYSAP